MRVLITAGPTRERIDAVRFLSNRSTGKMGYALAEAAHSMGHEVTLVSGPVALAAPEGVKLIRVESAREMAEGALRVSGADLAVSVTGIAGPDADGTDKPVGLVYIALSDGKTTKVQKICNSFTNNVREQNRNAAAQFALDWIRRWLDDA